MLQRDRGKPRFFGFNLKSCLILGLIQIQTTHRTYRVLPMDTLQSIAAIGQVERGSKGRFQILLISWKHVPRCREPNRKFHFVFYLTSAFSFSPFLLPYGLSSYIYVNVFQCYMGRNSASCRFLTKRDSCMTRVPQTPTSRFLCSP